MPARTHQIELEIFHGGRRVGRCLLEVRTYSLGRDNANDITIREESVSGRHAMLRVVSEEEIYLRDVGSENGTFVDEAFAGEELRIDRGSKIQLGDCTARLRWQRGYG